MEIIFGAILSSAPPEGGSWLAQEKIRNEGQVIRKQKKVNFKILYVEYLTRKYSFRGQVIV
jgi:hypothetical protein